MWFSVSHLRVRLFSVPGRRAQRHGHSHLPGSEAVLHDVREVRLDPPAAVLLRVSAAHHVPQAPHAAGAREHGHTDNFRRSRCLLLRWLFVCFFSCPRHARLVRFQAEGSWLICCWVPSWPWGCTPWPGTSFPSTTCSRRATKRTAITVRWIGSRSTWGITTNTMTSRRCPDPGSPRWVSWVLFCVVVVHDRELEIFRLNDGFDNNLRRLLPSTR